MTTNESRMVSEASDAIFELARTADSAELLAAAGLPADTFSRGGGASDTDPEWERGGVFVSRLDDKS